MLPAWNPDRLVRKIPFNLGLVGGRKMGKSCAVADLCERMSNRFDLVLAFIGSASCNPVLQFQMRCHWDDRFFFSEWDCGLIDRLLRQQEDLKAGGRTRHVLILMDDVILSSQAQDQICHLAMRGRHFCISLMMCSVSYTTMPKRMRRSLDVLMVFSCPMHGDMKILTWEYAHNTSMAKFALTNLEEHCCLVLETLERRQKLFCWKANLLSLESAESPEHERLRTEAAHETASERRSTDRQTETAEPSDRIESSGAGDSAGPQTSAGGPGPPCMPKSESVDPE